jgi:hypothetical protein
MNAGGMLAADSNTCLHYDGGTHESLPILLLASVVLVAGFLLDHRGTFSLAQTEQSSPTATQLEMPTPQPDPAGTIDGAKNPELIPDEVAYRMLFLAVAEPEDATDEQKARARGKIAAARFSEEDTEAFLKLTTDFHKEMTTVISQNAEIRARNPLPDRQSTDWAILVGLRKRMEANVTNTIAALPARLSEDGLRKLHAHLEIVKRGIKRIPLPKMDLMPKD